MYFSVASHSWWWPIDFTRWCWSNAY